MECKSKYTIRQSCNEKNSKLALATSSRLHGRALMLMSHKYRYSD